MPQMFRKSGSAAFDSIRERPINVNKRWMQKFCEAYERNQSEKIDKRSGTRYTIIYNKYYMKRITKEGIKWTSKI